MLQGVLYNLVVYYYHIASCICSSCNMGTSALPDMYAGTQAQGLMAYISGKAQVPML